MCDVAYEQLVTFIEKYHNKSPLHNIERRIAENPGLLKRLDIKLGSKLLRRAVDMRSEKIIDLMIEQKVDINPLELSIVKGDIESLKQQLDDGVKLRNHPKWEIFYVEKYLFDLRGCKSRKKMALVLARSLGVKVKNAFGHNYLHMLANYADEKDEYLVKVAKRLIKAKISINGQDKNGKTPLHKFSRRKNLEMLKLLIDKGADVNSQDNKLRTPLHSATVADHLDVIDLLLSRGADMNARDEDGNTALHEACKIHKEAEAIRFMMYKNPDVNALNYDNETPFNLLLSIKCYSNNEAFYVNLMIRELARMSFEGFTISEKNLASIMSNPKTGDYFDDCLAELELMWSLEFYEAYSYYSLLKMTFRMKKLVGLTKNFEFMLGCEKDLSEFHCYGDDIRRILNKATKIGDASSVVESRLTGIFGEVFPDLVIKCLAEHLTVGDLPK